MCPAAQNLGERIREGPWLRKLENVSVDHGVSLLRWRSGGVEHPHDTPPYPFMPSPTFAHSSPVGTGHVSSLSHPGGNVTGVSMLLTELSAKGLEILKQA